MGAASLGNTVKSLELPGSGTRRMWNTEETEVSLTARPIPYPLAPLALHRWMCSHRSSNIGKPGFTGEHRVWQLTTHTFMSCCHHLKIFKSAATQRSWVPELLSYEMEVLTLSCSTRTGTRVVEQLLFITNEHQKSFSLIPCMLGMEPRTLYMLEEYSITDLHPTPKHRSYRAIVDSKAGTFSPPLFRH